MSIHLKGIDMGLWRIISNGYTFAVATIEVPLTPAQFKENDRLESLDAKAMSILYCGLSTRQITTALALAKPLNKFGLG